MKNGLLNVIPAKTLKNLLMDVSDSIADVLANTLGPYGGNTIVQTPTSVYSTKDGWNVMQTLRVSDEKGESAVTVNALKKLIQDVAQAVLLNAGDGTSTSTIGAAILNRKVSEYLKSHNLDTRAINDALELAANDIVDELSLEAIEITEDNMEEIIYKIALVSTNWDEEISEIIRDIYVNTNNPIIKVEDSGTLETTVEYVEGYDLVGHLELPQYNLTYPAAGVFEAEDPLILTFGSAVHKDKLQALILMEGLLKVQDRVLVLVAPTYDADFLQSLAATNASQIQKRQKPLNIVPFKYFAKTAIDTDCVEDFACATGGILLTNEFAEVQEVFDKMEGVVRARADKTRKVNDRILKNEDAIISDCISMLDKIGGTCGKVKATDKYILASELHNKNTEEFERRKKALMNELDMKYKQYQAESTLTEMLHIKRLRLGKMQDTMGIIKVGGFGAANLKSKKDSIDDATRACEVAYLNGYIKDGGMAIPLAAKKSYEWYENKDNIAKYGKEPWFDVTKDFTKLFMESFREVAVIMFNNKYRDKKVSEEKVDVCLENGSCWDLIKDEFTDDLITPVTVCKEVINGCLRLVLINATSNQFVFMNEDDLIRAIQTGNRPAPRE